MPLRYSPAFVEIRGIVRCNFSLTVWNKYYEHIPHILNKLNGLPIPHFEPELEEKLRTMFKMIQSPFLRHAPSERKNFLSYSYVLHKMCQLLGKDEYLQNFSLNTINGQKSCTMNACGYSIHAKPIWRPRKSPLACLQLVAGEPTVPQNPSL